MIEVGVTTSEPQPLVSPRLSHNPLLLLFLSFSGVHNCIMSAGAAGDVLCVFIEAAAQTRYIHKQLVPSIQSRQEQVGLSRLTAPSLTQPPPYGPQQPERRLCQNCVTHKDWNKMEDLVPKGIYAHCGGGADVSCCFWWAGRCLNLWHLVRVLIGKYDVQKGVNM